MTTTRARRPRSVPTLVRNLALIADELAERTRGQLWMRAFYEDPRRTPKLPDSTADDIMRSCRRLIDTAEQLLLLAEERRSWRTLTDEQRAELYRLRFLLTTLPTPSTVAGPSICQTKDCRITAWA